MPTTLNLITGIGLITGQPCEARLKASEQPGIRFIWPNGELVIASLNAVHATERGVTLLGPNGQTLSIVEHFLAACALCNVNQLDVWVNGPELPILDGSAAGWMDALKPFSDLRPVTPKPLPQAIRVEQGDSWLTAEPAPRFSITYTVDFPHAALRQKTVSWSPADPDAERLAVAGTFGLVSELPALQAKGLGLGVTIDNTLGLTDDGGFTRPLRMPEEPAYHKILDCLGDLTLTGVNPLSLGMHITAYKAGHKSHLLLAKALSEVIV